MPATPQNGTAAAALLKERDKSMRAADAVDRDPEEALDKLVPTLQVAPNVGEITVQDMFQLMSQLMQQQATMQAQIVSLMTGELGGQKKTAAAYTAEELARDKKQRDDTLASWQTEPREPIWLQPEPDEEKVFSVMGKYPPRMFRVNGLEFPITPGEIQNVPSSIARMVETSQKRRPFSGPPQGLGAIADPARAQFLRSAASIEIGRQGRVGEGRIEPEGLPPHPQALGMRYDDQGQ